MPVEERSKGGSRCSLHPSIPSIAVCDACGRPLCLTCAIPVRGRTLGAECLATAMGDRAPVSELVEREPGATARTVALVAFAVAVAATVVPWSRFGPGSQPFGAWSAHPRWSLLPATAAVAGLGISVARGLARRRGRGWDLAASLAGALVAIGSLLAIARPPAFTSPWLGPWLAFVAGCVATGAAVSTLRRVPIRETARS